MLGLTRLFILELIVKGATFALNQVLVRSVAPETLGQAAVYDLLVSTILFYSREAGRLAVQRAPQSAVVTQKIVNFGFFSLALAVPFSAAIFWFLGVGLNWTLTLLLALVFLELLLEPLYLLHQYNLNFSVRSRMESLAVLGKCVFTLCAISRTNNEAGFAAGHAVYAFILLAGYSFGGAPKKAEGAYLDPQILKMWRILFVQMLFKYLLTEGDHLLIGWFLTLEDQGVYTVVGNYGSLVARLVFQPVEEYLRNTFTRLFAEKDAQALEKGAKTMGHLFVGYTIFSVFLIVGGFCNGEYVMLHLLSSRWRGSAVETCFSHYMLYLPFMAFNGVLEAFFTSAAAPADINRFSLFMLALSVAVALALVPLVKTFGLDGIIMANALNMSLRIIYCCVFLSKTFRNISMDYVSRLKVPLTAGVAVFAAQYQVFGLRSRNFQDFATSGALCFAALCAMLYVELPNLRQK